MRKVAWVSLCLICGSHGRRMQSSWQDAWASKPVTAWLASAPDVAFALSPEATSRRHSNVQPLPSQFVNSAGRHDLKSHSRLAGSNPMALSRQRQNHFDRHSWLIGMNTAPSRDDDRISEYHNDANLSSAEDSSQKIDTNASVKVVPVAEVALVRDRWRNPVDVFGFACLAVSKVSSRIVLRAQSPVLSSEEGGVQPTRRKGLQIDIPLLTCIALWYIGNYYFSITNKRALVAAGGSAGFPITIGTMQLAIGVLYAVFLWAAPDARSRPSITFKDYLKTLPVGATAAGAYAATVFALSAGTISFVQVVKAAEPAFTALVGWVFYRDSVSTARLLCLIPIIGGVVLASVGELNFVWIALATSALANFLAAIQVNENKKLMSSAGISDRLGHVGNQFAITVINAFVFCIPLMIATEGHKFGAFLQLCKTNSVVLNNLVFSGLWLYLSNELATIVIKKTGALAQSVANTAKRVIVIIVVAMAIGEDLGVLKLLGCLIGIGGVFLYSIIDQLVAKKESSDKAVTTI